VRDDCHKFIQLLLVVLDAAKGEVHFQCLCALHKARWMAKWIYMYGLKIAFVVHCICCHQQWTTIIGTNSKSPSGAIASCICHICYSCVWHVVASLWASCWCTTRSSSTDCCSMSCWQRFPISNSSIQSASLVPHTWTDFTCII